MSKPARKVFFYVQIFSIKKCVVKIVFQVNKELTLPYL